MYPVIRLLICCTHALNASSLDIHDVCETTFRCRPWDLDMFMEVNNGRLLTLYDLGRFDLSIRTGLSKKLKENRWGLVVAGGSVRYRRRVRAFDKVTIRTQVVGVDERWFYIAQSMWVKGQPTSSILLRTGITSKGRVVPAEDVFTAMNAQHWQPEIPVWVEKWIEADHERPWPPVP